MVPKASLATPTSSYSISSTVAAAASFLLGATCLMATVSVVPAESSHIALPPVPSHHVPPLLSLVSAFRGGVAAPAGRLQALHYRSGSNPRLFRDFFTGFGYRNALDFR